MIRTIEDHDIKKLKHVLWTKNVGPDAASRLPIEDNVKDNEIHMNIKKHAFKDIFPLDVNHMQKIN